MNHKKRHIEYHGHIARFFLSCIKTTAESMVTRVSTAGDYLSQLPRQVLASVTETLDMRSKMGVGSVSKSMYEDRMQIYGHPPRNFTSWEFYFSWLKLRLSEAKRHVAAGRFLPTVVKRNGQLNGLYIT